MNNLETEINQIYLIHPDNFKAAVIMFEEDLGRDQLLFFITYLDKIKRKSENTDLNKISSLIIQTFKDNLNLNGETLFESSLAEINQGLADLAHSGRKAWIGKLSAIIALKNRDSIYLSNCGQTSSWLKRDKNLMEILGSEPDKGAKPLKTFINFSAGRLRESDQIILTTTNIFNFVSLPLFTRLLNESDANHVSNSLSQIFKQSASNSEVFGTYFLNFSQNATVPSKIENSGAIYAPMPEDLETEKYATQPKPLWKFSLPHLPHLSSLKLIFSKIKNFIFTDRMSPAKKFFLASFLIFILVFAANLGVYVIRKYNKNEIQKIQSLTAVLKQDIAETESALIYQNNNSAQDLLLKTQKDYDDLKKLNKTKAQEFSAQILEITKRVTRISTISEPKVLTEFRTNPSILTKAGNGLILANTESKTILSFDSSPKELFLINDTGSNISGIAHASGVGNFVVSGNKLFRINQDQKQFEQTALVNNAEFSGLRFLEPNRLYSLDSTGNAIYRFTLKDGKIISAQNILKITDKAKIVDFALDKDIYLLYPDRIIKYVGTKAQAFALPSLNEKIASANKIFVASNLYVLEASKKRLLVISKLGVLINQLEFPNASDLKDFYVDENARIIYLLDGKKLLEITF